MEVVTLWWPIAGAVVGLFGGLGLLLALGDLMNGIEVSRERELLIALVCPAVLMVRGFWRPVALNCVLYSLIVETVRFFWITLHR